MRELEKILEEIDNRVHFYDNADEPMMYVETVKKIISKHMNDGWISVEERLPKNEGYYLVTFSESEEVRLLGYGNCRRNIKWESIGFGWYDISTATYFDENSVIAWRPIPEPYRPERSE